ncbi:MAG: alcohol dehydrogenase catalytic domain-containing protein [Corallococcus sp.]|nr:alcohol dehydrogenase catalytic domain-containing protein [Corallococcus sp.]MCM1395845.1 alcohol dehydrogenase catalytic domain-containing protein [Corallococcus sp.]
MEKMMKCAIYYGIGDVRMEERPVPSIGDDDVLVKVLRAGICGSDTGAYLYGGEPAGIFKGQQFGHELVGKIVEKGKNVKDVQLDDIVFVDPMLARKSGSFSCDMLGAFSEYVKVENAKLNHNVYVLDRNIDLDAAAIIEPVSVGTRGATRLNPSLNDNVVVLGAGTIGLSAAAGLLARGVKNVIVVDQVDWRLAKAVELGAKVIDTSKDNLLGKLLEYCGEVPQGAPFNPAEIDPELLKQVMEFAQKAHMSFDSKKPNIDLVVDCAGALPLLQQLFNLAKWETKYVIVAVYHKELVLNPNVFIMHQPTVTASKGYVNETILEVIDHISKEKTPIKTIVTKKFKHAYFVEAMKAACDVKNNIKVIIDYEM